MSPLNLILTGFVRTHSNQFQLAAHSAESNAFYLAASATSISQAKGTKSRGPTRIIHCANSSMCLPSNCRMSGLIRFPSESNVSGAEAAIKTPGFTMTMVLVSPRVSSNCIWARAVPDRPPAPMIVPGFPISDPSSRSREAQSMAFFSTPDVPQLYSGVAKITPSDSRIADLRALTGSGSP